MSKDDSKVMTTLVTDKPAWVELWLRCRGCGVPWVGWQPTGVSPKVWLVAIKSLRCPKCGGGSSKQYIQSGPSQ